MMNVNKSPTDDARVRRAIFVAVDREAINQANIAGAGTVGSPVQTWAGLGMSQEELVQQPGFRMAADGSKHPDDLQMARDLLAEAGYADGLDITLRFSLTEGQNPDSAALFLSIGWWSITSVWANRDTGHSQRPDYRRSAVPGFCSCRDHLFLPSSGSAGTRWVNPIFRNASTLRA